MLYMLRSKISHIDEDITINFERLNLNCRDAQLTDILKQNLTY